VLPQPMPNSQQTDSLPPPQPTCRIDSCSLILTPSFFPFRPSATPNTSFPSWQCGPRARIPTTGYTLCRTQPTTVRCAPGNLRTEIDFWSLSQAVVPNSGGSRIRQYEQLLSTESCQKNRHPAKRLNLLTLQLGTCHAGKTAPTRGSSHEKNRSHHQAL